MALSPTTARCAPLAMHCDSGGVLEEADISAHKLWNAGSWQGRVPYCAQGPSDLHRLPNTDISWPVMTADEAHATGCVPQVIKISPYALPAAHRDLLDLSRSLNWRYSSANATDAY